MFLLGEPRGGEGRRMLILVRKTDVEAGGGESQLKGQDEGKEAQMVK